MFTSPFKNYFRLFGKDAFGNDIFRSNRLGKKNVTDFIELKKNSELDREEIADWKTKVDREEKFENLTGVKNEKTNNKFENAFSSNASEHKESSGRQKNFTSNEDVDKGERKNIKKEYSKEIKKAAQIAAVSNFLRAKKITQNQLANMSGEVTGDLIKDGAGFLKVITESLKEAFMMKLKASVISMLASFFSFLTSIISTIAPLIIITMVVVVFMSFISVFTEGVEVPDGDGIIHTSLEDEEVDEIMEKLFLLYPDMYYEQEEVVRYVLSKVGCEYDQNYHGSLTEDIFDCSSLAYRSYLEIGIDISNKGMSTASEECRMVVEGMHLATGELQPGDLIFYGGSDNGKYMGVYHVAIYVGDGKMVEARGESWGVVYCDARTENVVAYGRYI